MLRFKGHLLLPSEPGPGLKVDLEVADHHLAVVSQEGGLGAWPLETVQVRRLHGDTFEMTVAGEDLHFVADDTISFTYSGIPAIERIGRPSGSRSPFRTLIDRFGGGTKTRSTTAEDFSEEEPDLSEETEIALPQASPEPAVSAASTEVDHSETEEGPDEPITPSRAPVTEPAKSAPPPVELPDFVMTPPAAPPEPMPDQSPPEPDDDSHSEPPPDDSQASPSHCPATTTEGQPCRSTILAPSGFCAAHDPERSVEDDYRKAKEARARLKSRSTARLNRIYARLDKAVREVERGELEPDKAAAMAQLARTMCAILSLEEESTEEVEGLRPRLGG